MVNIRYIGKYDGEDLRPVSFWCEPTRYDFEISWNEETEDIELIEKEFRLNVKNQFEDNFIRFK